VQAHGLCAQLAISARLTAYSLAVGKATQRAVQLVDENTLLALILTNSAKDLDFLCLCSRFTRHSLLRAQASVKSAVSHIRQDIQAKQQQIDDSPTQQWPCSMESASMPNQRTCYCVQVLITHSHGANRRLGVSSETPMQPIPLLQALLKCLQLHTAQIVQVLYC